MKIDIQDKEISFTFPRFQQRYNPYDEDGDYGEHPTFTGLIIRHRKDGNYYDELGFASTIDRDYKGKDDDIGDFIVKWFDSEESFVEICKKLKIDIHYLDL